MTPEQINLYAIKIYNQNVQRGWWDNPNRCTFQTLQLVNREISEATEGDRQNLMDDHLPHRKSVEVELADTLIRMLDLSGRYQWTYRKTAHSRRIEGYASLASAHFWLTASVLQLGDSIYLGRSPESSINQKYSTVIQNILYISEKEGYELKETVDEKLEYNLIRADHNRENRGRDKGKRY